jgi:hypothetical protein
MPITILWKILTLAITLALFYLYLGHLSVETAPLGAPAKIILSNMTDVLNCFSLLLIGLSLFFHYHYNVQAKPTAQHQKLALT